MTRPQMNDEHWRMQNQSMELNGQVERFMQENCAFRGEMEQMLFHINGLEAVIESITPELHHWKILANTDATHKTVPVFEQGRVKNESDQKEKGRIEIKFPFDSYKSQFCQKSSG